MEVKALQPTWLFSLLRTKFYRSCESHNPKKYNHFCTECAKPICQYCKEFEHNGHLDKILQVYKASEYPSIRVATSCNLLDISEIQQYMINGFNIVFINRPQKDHGSSYKVARKCETCRRDLVSSQPSSPTARFCSIGCKVFASLGLIAESYEEEGVKVEASTSKSKQTTESNENVHAGSKASTSTTKRMVQSSGNVPARRNASTSYSKKGAPPLISCRKRNRKGVPRRAPLF